MAEEEGEGEGDEKKRGRRPHSPITAYCLLPGLPAEALCLSVYVVALPLGFPLSSPCGALLVSHAGYRRVSRPARPFVYLSIRRSDRRLGEATAGTQAEGLSEAAARGGGAAAAAIAAADSCRLPLAPKRGRRHLQMSGKLLLLPPPCSTRPCAPPFFSLTCSCRRQPASAHSQAEAS